MNRWLLAAIAVTLCVHPHSAFAQETVIYYTTDAIGSVRMITDASGQVVERHDYLPFGEEYPLTQQQPSVEKRRFGGKEHDQETGFEYFEARYYMSGTGRFTTVDPDHVGGNVADPQSWNAYAYARNNPFRFVDPSGQDSCPVVDSDAYTCVEGKAGTGQLTLDYSLWMLEALFAAMSYQTPGVMGAPIGPPIGSIESLVGASGTRLGITAETSILARASQSAFQAAARADKFTLGAKHAAGAAGRWAKFAQGVNPNAVLREALNSPKALIQPNNANSFKVITDVGRVIRSKGETAVRVIVDFSGQVVTWFPVRP
jgi:RHS repeat-associated protein